MMNALGLLVAAVALVPAPREQVWREGTCTFAEKDIRFVRGAAIPPGGYRLDITPDGVTVASADDAGAFYARKTLKQLGTNAVPCGMVTDWPAFRWRGFMLDEGRHFFGKETVKGLLDLMADHKLNVFHWHLTEDQGWRLEIKKYPLLTEVGSFRAGTQTTTDRSKHDGKRYGGYYTQEQVREVVAYAEKLGITVIPELDLPGHMLGALASYPWLGCTGGPYQVWTRWGVCDQVLCVGKESTFEFLFNVLDEICELFPSEYIHIGGDECPKKEWDKCPICQAKMDELGLVADEKGTRGQKLQNYVTKRVQEHLAAKGRKIIGWDEILEGELGAGATVMSWRGTKGGEKASAMGFDVIMSPTTYCYLDYKQGLREDDLAIGAGYPKKSDYDARNLYSYEPLAGIDAGAEKHILGVQANMWTEWIHNDSELFYMLIPRLQALSEVQWTMPEKRSYEHLEQKLTDKHFKIMEMLGYNYRAL